MSYTEQATEESPRGEKRPIHSMDIDQELDPEKIPYEHDLHDTLKTIAGISGNVLEWYDFAVFGFFGDISEYSLYNCEDIRVYYINSNATFHSFLDVLLLFQSVTFSFLRKMEMQPLSNPLPSLVEHFLCDPSEAS
jgi:hypothetical protein